MGCFILCLGVARVSFASTEFYEIENLTLTAHVDESHRIEVTEEIQGAFHGETDFLTRIIPLVRDGVRYDLSQVSGTGVRIELEEEGDQALLRIKKMEGAFFGKEEFLLHYVLQAGLDGDRDQDRFVLTIIYPDWNTYIHQASMLVELPANPPAQAVTFTGGSKGNAGRKTMSFQVDGNRVTAHTDTFLVPEEAVTLQVMLPEGTFWQAQSLESFYERTEGISHGLMGGIFLVALGLWLMTREKEPKADFRREPPYKANAAEISYLFTRHVETRDFSILVIEWASRGWIHIHPNFSAMGGDEGAVITLERRPPDDIRPFELRFFHLLFDDYGNGHRVRLDHLRGDFFRHLKELKAHLALDCGKGKEAFYKHDETKATIALTFLSSLPIFFFWIRASVDSFGPWLGLVLSLILVVLEVIAIRLAEYGHGPGQRVLGGLMLAILAGLAFWPGRVIRLIGFLTATALGLLIAYLAKRSGDRTPYGIGRMGQYLGYREFLAGADRDQVVDMMQTDPDLYFKGLAYADRLGVLDAWQDAFKDVFNLAPI
jgi:hypothetical protein